MFYGLDKLCPNLREPIASVAHRGYSTRYPENSAEAILGAAIEHVDIIEVDVLLSKDGGLICRHDSFVKECRCNIGAEGSQYWVDHGLYRLEDVAVTVPEDTAIVLDCKSDNQYRAEAFSDAFQRVKRIHKRSAVYSNSIAVLRVLRAVDSGAILLKGTMTGSVLGKWPDLVDGYMAGGEAVAEEYVKNAHGFGKFVLVHRSGLNSRYPTWSSFLKYAVSIHADGALCADVGVFGCLSFL